MLSSPAFSRIKPVVYVPLKKCFMVTSPVPIRRNCCQKGQSTGEYCAGCPNLTGLRNAGRRPAGLVRRRGKPHFPRRAPVMRITASLGIVVLAGAFTGSPAAAKCAPMADKPRVEVKGRIVRVRAAPGQGMPSLEVEQNGSLVKVLLGPLRYLMEQNFNPKTGMMAEVKGYRMADAIVAITITLPGVHKTIRLRDEAGWPVWVGGECRQNDGDHAARPRCAHPVAESAASNGG